MAFDESSYGEGRPTFIHDLLCGVLRAIAIIVVVTMIIFLALALSHHRNLEVYVENVTLNRFDLSPDMTLHYNLTLDMNFTNPNGNVGIHFDRLETAAFYAGAPFGYWTVPMFQQSQRSTAILHPMFEGEESIKVWRPSAIAMYEKERKDGFFCINVNIYTSTRLKRALVNGAKYTPEVGCYLRLREVNASAWADGGFTRLKCQAKSFY